MGKEEREKLLEQKLTKLEKDVMDLKESQDTEVAGQAASEKSDSAAAPIQADR